MLETMNINISKPVLVCRKHCTDLANGPFRANPALTKLFLQV
jgi:hypothetical protein